MIEVLHKDCIHCPVCALVCPTNACECQHYLSFEETRKCLDEAFALSGVCPVCGKVGCNE